MNENREETVQVSRFPRFMPVGEGEARGVYVRLVAEGFDGALAGTVVYNIAEGFSREAGEIPGDAMRFHEDTRRHVGATLPEGLDADELMDRARDAMQDADLIDGKTIAEIEEIALVIGQDIRRGAVPAP